MVGIKLGRDFCYRWDKCGLRFQYLHDFMIDVQRKSCFSIVRKISRCSKKSAFIVGKLCLTHPRKLNFGMAAMPLLCRDVGFLSYHRKVTLAVNLPMFLFSLCQKRARLHLLSFTFCQQCSCNSYEHC